MTQVEAYTRLAGVYDEIVVDPCHGAWASFLDDLWRDDEPGVRDVLDVCCGTGLLAAELTALGYRVVGVDASDAMLVRARQLLGPDVPLVRTTLPELTVEGVFDAAVCTYDGLNYLDPAGLRATFTALGGRLRPAGWLVFDVHTDTMMRFISSQPVVDGDRDGHRYVIESTVDAGARTCDTRIEVEGANGFTEHHRQYFHRASEVRAALVASGFEVTAVRDDYSDRTVDSSALSATWIARRRGLPDRVAP
ncbi:MAG TPA: methyltransferase domain-containing protein [Gaiellaceae bacterium]|nr:methyltransferase domain-containing protein [Gaiellaceae bacterium]